MAFSSPLAFCPLLIAFCTLVTVYATGWERAPPFNLSNVGAAGVPRAFLSLGCAAYVYVWWTFALRRSCCALEILFAVVSGVTVFAAAVFDNDDFPTFHDLIGGVGVFSAYFWVGAVIAWRGPSFPRVVAMFAFAGSLVALAALYMRGDGGFDVFAVGFGLFEAVGWFAHAVVVGSVC